MRVKQRGIELLLAPVDPGSFLQQTLKFVLDGFRDFDQVLNACVRLDIERPRKAQQRTVGRCQRVRTAAFISTPEPLRMINASGDPDDGLPSKWRSSPGSTAPRPQGTRARASGSWR